MQKKLIPTTVLVLLALPLGIAEALPIEWTLSGVTFDDGGTAVGSFVFDADTMTYSDVVIQTTAGSVLGGVSYENADVFTAANARFLALGLDFGARIFAMIFAEVLSSAGGDVSIFTDLHPLEATCDHFSCSPPVLVRFITGGSVVAAAASSAVPEPTGFVLFLAGLYGISRSFANASRSSCGFPFTRSPSYGPHTTL